MFECIPLKASWERYDPVNPMPPSDYHCGVDNYRLVLSAGIVHILLLAMIILLPIRYIWQLTLSTYDKLCLYFTFFLAISYVLSSPNSAVVVLESGG